jgi:hypothetical protein
MPCINQSVFSIMIRIAGLMSAMSLPSTLQARTLAGDAFKFRAVAAKIFGPRSQNPQNQGFMKNPAPVPGNRRSVDRMFLDLEAFCRQE